MKRTLQPVLSTLLVLAVLATATSARAQDAQPSAVVPPAAAVRDDAARTPRPGFHEHDGFFLRLTAGPGYAGSIARGTAVGPKGGSSLVDPEFNGASLNGTLSLGGAIAPDLILHLEGILEVHNGHRGATWLESGYVYSGLGVTRYFMPANLFLTASAGMAITSYVVHAEVPKPDVPGETREAKRVDWAPGVGASLTVGKEWWVSANWSLGLALQGTYSYCRNSDIQFHNAGGRLLLTATYN